VIDIAKVKADRVKITILSGFLGAGKTTLLNHIIRQNQDRKIAILVNDFGKINIDNDLIDSREEFKLNLTGGCICCTIQKDLVSSIIQLMKQPEKPEYLIVECSGAADPSQVLSTLSSPVLKFHLYVDGLITVIDSNRLLDMENNEHKRLAEHQIKAANLLVLNKTDCVDEQKLDMVKAFVRKISPDAVMLTAVRCQVPVDLILGFKDLPKVKPVSYAIPMDVHVHDAHDQGSGSGLVNILSEVPQSDSSKRDKPHDLVFESWSFTSDRPFRKKAFKKMLEHISPDIIRGKGFVYWDDPENPLMLFNLVGNWIDLDVYFKKQGLLMETRLVFIGNPGWKTHSDIEQQLIHCQVGPALHKKHGNDH
jgi:G3E family GTPase